MSDLNRCTLIGRLTRDPEIRQTAGGGTVASLRLAVNTRKKVGDAWEDTPGFYDVVCFGRTAETAGSYLVKGRRVGVDGRLQWREWDGKDGGKRQAVEVVASDVFFLDPRSGTEDGHTPRRPDERPRGGDLPVDDIPF